MKPPIVTEMTLMGIRTSFCRQRSTNLFIFIKRRKEYNDGCKRSELFGGGVRRVTCRIWDSSCQVLSPALS